MISLKILSSYHLIPLSCGKIPECVYILDIHHGKASRLLLDFLDPTGPKIH